MKSAFTRTAAAMFSVAAALFFLAVPSAKATPTNAPYGLFTISGTGTIASNTFTFSNSDSAATFSNPVGPNFQPVTFSPSTNLSGLSTPTQLFTVTEGSSNLTFFLTSVSSVVNAASGVTGSFTGVGYFTDSSFPSTDYYGTFSLTNSAQGAGDQIYSVSLMVGTPEPSGLILLGTGLLAMALVAGKKFRTV